jgi:hypothetical protein
VVFFFEILQLGASFSKTEKGRKTITPGSLATIDRRLNPFSQ